MKKGAGGKFHKVAGRYEIETSGYGNAGPKNIREQGDEKKAIG